MIRSLWTAASGMRAGQLRVDNTSHNIANVNTPGYRRSQIDFADLLYQPSAEGRLLVGSGVYPLAVTRDLTPAALEGTGKPLDLAVAGEGFFILAMPDGQLQYTRDGAFYLDANGRLVTSSGLSLVLEPAEGMDGEVLIPGGATDISISESGAVSYQFPDTEETILAGHIRLGLPVPAIAGRTVDMLPQGDNRYAPALGTVIEVREAGVAAGEIRQGYLERSNVSLVDEIIDLILAQRAYEFSSKAVQTADQMLALANNIRRG